MLKQNNILFLEKHISKIVLFFTLTPFLILCFFNAPLGDDFWYASRFIENGFVDTQLKYYNEWSGRYMATFTISTLNPLSYGYLNLAFIHPFLLIIGTCLSLRMLIYNAVKTFKLNVNKHLLFSLLVFFYFNYIPDIGESFYWMAGAYTYQLPIIFFMLYLNSLIYIFNTESNAIIAKNICFGLFCLVVVIGSNEVIALYSFMINILILMFLFLQNRKSSIRFLPLFIITFLLVLFMIFAPGNYARESIFEKPDFHLLKSSLNAFSRGFFMLFFWLPTLTFVLLLVPNIYKTTTPKLEISRLDFFKNKRNVVFVSIAFLLMVLFFGFFPSIYTTKWIPQRAYTPIFFIFTLIASLFIFMAIRKIKLLNNLNDMLSNVSAGPLLLLIVLVSLSHNSNVMNAYTDLTSGKAISYNKQVVATYKMLETSSQKDTIYIKELKKTPLVLPTRWPSKHNRLVNHEWEIYFKIKRVEAE